MNKNEPYQFVKAVDNLTVGKLIQYDNCVFDHEPIDKEHKLVSIQICYRRFTPFANISCGRRRMSLCVDDDKLRASLIDWWDPIGTFDYDQEALTIQAEFVKLLNKYGIKREVWR